MNPVLPRLVVGTLLLSTLACSDTAAPRYQATTRTWLDMSEAFASTSVSVAGLFGGEIVDDYDDVAEANFEVVSHRIEVHAARSYATSLAEEQAGHTFRARCLRAADGSFAGMDVSDEGNARAFCEWNTEGLGYHESSVAAWFEATDQVAISLNGEVRSSVSVNGAAQGFQGAILTVQIERWKEDQTFEGVLAFKNADGRDATLREELFLDPGTYRLTCRTWEVLPAVSNQSDTPVRMECEWTTHLSFRIKGEPGWEETSRP